MAKPQSESDSPIRWTPPADSADAEGADVSISMERANVIAGFLLPVIAAGVLVPFGLLWGWDAIVQGASSAFWSWSTLPVLLVAIVVHEGLHALGFLLFGRAPRDALHFGIHRETLSPFAGCRAPVTARAYRGAVALPALTLGGLPAGAGLWLGSGWLVMWGTFMLAAAGGDLIVLWTIRSVPGPTPVLDHPERVGCRVLHPPRHGMESA